MPGKPTALVLRAAGTNCDGEMVRAFELAGADAQLVHLDRLIENPRLLAGADLIGFPGGFSYGDDIASGRIFAMKVRERLYPALKRAVDDGCLIIGACNGFQVMVQCGLLPGPQSGEQSGETPPPQRVSLTDNQDARFCDRWVGVEFNPRSVCVWTRGLTDFPEDTTPAHVATINQLPVAHGEGRFVTAEPAVLKQLEQNGQVVLRYTDNYNGSEGAVAGICDTTGRVFGLMPHPERYLDWTRHPYWTRLDASTRKGATPGLRIFQNAVEAAKGVVVA
ncbi:MAG TPA: phosphoribosylformylglycinamidine synthase subunit PurQ [Phycisphaerales bacterium]|nr:phosphoribosylformylglycinamidine synthase subunit PurQ [Phycisphaerales bacterium]